MIACVTRRSSITYGDLFDRVARLSATIVDRSTSTQWLPVVVDRSIESVVALLAILRAGRPFVPMDGATPRARIREMFDLVGTPSTAVTARPSMAAVLPEGTRTIDIDDAGTDTGPAVSIDPDAPGLVLFTSGSTGRPKGVLLRWSAVDRWQTKDIRRPGQNRLSVARPLNFSGGFGQTTRITNGTTLCMIDPREVSLQVLIEFLAEMRVTNVSLGSALIDLLLRLNPPMPLFPEATELSLQGYPCTWDDVERIRRVCSPNATVINGFASTESGGVARFRAGPNDPMGSGPIPIGAPNLFDRITLFDVDGGQEIWVRDPDVLEYVGTPELSAERIVTDDNGTRWWRSGDLGRIDDQGYLYLSGRMDDMVKINGMRVEPAEAVRALRRIPGIPAAAVLPHATTHGSHRLIGHVVVDDPLLTPEIVRASLVETLPAHLIPAFFMKHESLPYSDRQKLDRSALLQTPVERWRSHTPTRALHEPLRWITTRVEEIIGLGDVAPNDDFWDVGLDSIGAVELCSMIADQGLGQLDPTDLLRHRTAVDLEQHLMSARSAEMSPAVAFNAHGSRPAVFAIPGGGGTAVAFRSLAAALGEDQPLIVIEPKGMHCKGPLERTVRQRVTTAVAEMRARLEPEDQCIVLGYSGGATIAMEIARTLTSIGHPTHLVLLDGPPRDARHNRLSSDGKAGNSMHRPGGQVTKSARRRLSRLVRRTIHKSSELAREIRIRVGPGSWRYSRDYYRFFRRLNRRALLGHRLSPLASPTTLIHVEGSTVPEMCTPWFSDLTCHLVGGDHFSMLYPPHVDRIARHIVAIRDSIPAD